MKPISHIFPDPSPRPAASPRRAPHSSFIIQHSAFSPAFSLMELMVAISILVVIILAVGVTFSGASASVSMSQAVMEEMSAVRAAQQLLERDLQGLDKDGFLVIRSRYQNGTAYNYDQLSFLSQGTFQNRTGADTNTPFTDSTTSNAAHIWWGQLIVEKNGVAGFATPLQSAGVVQNQLPTGLPTGNMETDSILGHHVTLLVPGPADNNNHVMTAGNPVMAYATIDGPNCINITGSVEGASANIASSRYAVAAQTPAQVMQYVISARAATPPIPYPESDLLTYRFRTLSSVYDTEVANNPFVNGYFRTTPTVMAGVSSFRVEWTDGSWDALNQLKWYGAANPNGNMPPGTEQFNASGLANGDQYVAVFSYFNKTVWPKALRITMHVANNRIGGRDFVQVVNLP